MMLESITVDWKCGDCGNVRRMDITDVTRTVAFYRPQGWILDRGRVKCGLCAVSPGSPAPVAAPSRESAEQMRERMSNLHMGRSDPSPAQGIGTPAGVTAVTVRGEGGTKSHVQLQGEARYSTYGEAPKPPAEPAHPARVLPGMGGVSSHTINDRSAAQPAVAGDSIPVDPADSWTGPPPTRVGGGPNVGGLHVVIEDTRNSEFLGPEKIVAGVPHLTNACCICNITIQDGTTGYGGSERWRLAKDSTFERGHNDCLNRAGR